VPAQEGGVGICPLPTAVFLKIEINTAEWKEMSQILIIESNSVF
jgi:hypothetical protein